MNRLFWSYCFPLSPTKRLVWTESVQECWNVRLSRYGSLVTKLLNESIRTSRFPEIWKCSKVTTLFKSGDQTNASTYRPISILSTRSKILERAVQFQLYDYLNTNHLLTDKQFGFQPKHLMVTALVRFAVDVLKHGVLESLWSCILGFVKGYRYYGLQYPARQVIFLGIKS